MKTYTVRLPLALADTAGIFKTSAFTVSAISIAVVLPVFFHSQWITGPIINAMLLTAAVVLGTRAAFALALLPAPIALVSGLLPAVMAPMIPFIMIGNIALVAAFVSLYKDSALWAVLIGAGVKFALIGSVAYFLMERLVPQEVHSTLVSMMGMPQFITAVLGGVLALVTLRALR